MNKYQQAFETICALALYQAPKPRKDGRIGHIHVQIKYIEDFDAIAELINKATPKKPGGIDTTVSWFTSGICECGNTVFMFDINGDLDDEFCNKCGQALDWSQDDNPHR